MPTYRYHASTYGERMTVDERRRHALFSAAADAFGEEQAETMFAMLPSSDVATRADLDELFGNVVTRADLGLRFADVDQRFAQVDQRFAQIDDRFAQVDVRFAQLEGSMDALRSELLAAFRQELVTAVSGQTRAVIVAVATAVFGIGGLAVTLAQVL